MSGGEWFYSDRGERRGPVDEAFLRRLAQIGEVNGATLVWRDGMADWEPAHRRFPDLVPPPPPGAGQTRFQGLPSMPGGGTYHEVLNIREAFRRYWRRAFDFRGRSNRGEYWWAILATILVAIVLGIVESLLFGEGGRQPLSSLWSLATLIPTLSLSVRRLHDVDRTGWWVVAPAALAIAGTVLMLTSVLSGRDPGLAAIVFLAAGVTGIVLVVWACQRGTSGPNRFG